MVSKDDWRLTSQEKYLKGVHLEWKVYTRYREGWEHDHCSFCWTKFMETAGPEILTEGYATKDNYRWICKECFEDFREMFAWTVNK